MNPSAHVLAQERFERDGVLVSRPRAEDVQVHDFLKTQSIASPGDYFAWLKANIAYVPDTEDVWSDPAETLRRRRGDCEDYAFLTKEVLHVLGSDAQVLILDRGRAQHAVCIFRNGSHYAWVDNTEFHSSPRSSLENFLKDLRENYLARRLGLAVRNPNRVRWINV